MKKILIPAFLICLILPDALSQNESDIKSIVKETNLQKTANSKDILTSLFRANIDNLLGDNHSFTFNSSFFGIDSLFRKKGTQISYERERSLRQKSFNIELTGDSVNNITKIAGGFTFTLLNKKDITYTKFREEDSKKLIAMAKFMNNLNRQLISAIEEKYAGQLTDSLRKVIRDSWREADRKNDYTALHPYLKEALANEGIGKSALAADAAAANPLSGYEANEVINDMLKGKDAFHALFVTIGEKYARKPLWTFSPTFAYDRVNEQGDYSFATEFTAGLGKDLTQKPWELEIKASFKISNDTSQHKRNYDNKPFLISLGVNKVIVENEDKEPKMEFKFFTQYDHQFGTVPAEKDAGMFTLNSTFRVNIFKSLWLPVTLKYDPKNSNFLGYFSITANLGD